MTRTLHHADYPARRIADAREDAGSRAPAISVCVPTKECAQTIVGVAGPLVELCETGVIDEVVVVDAASRDGTAALAEGAGAIVYQEAALMREMGPVLGKGDAMWRAASVLRGDLICFLDGDTRDFSPHFATGLLGPLLCEPGISFVKAFYRRPFEDGGISLPEGGGRVNHLLARPALALFYPELAGVRQPLAGEVAIRRELLERIPLVTGYGVEVAMLIDVWREVGLDGIAQVDLEVHRNQHQPLMALVAMARTVLETIAVRLQADGRLVGFEPGEPPVERPPHGASARSSGGGAS